MVFLLQGTGNFDRDCEFGNSRTLQDLLFRELAEVFTAEGVAVLRIDYRGVYGNSFQVPEEFEPEERKQFFLQRLFSADVRATVTPENIRSDFLQAYEWAISQELIDPTRVLVLAHSEGSIHAAALVGDGRIPALGCLMLTGIATSPKSVVHYQSTSRWADLLMELDADGDGKLFPEEFSERFAGSRFQALYPTQTAELLEIPPTGLTRAAVESETLPELQSAYEAQVHRVTAAGDGADALLAGGTRAWWRMWYTDSQPVIARLLGFPGRVIYYWGGRDTQVNQALEERALQEHSEGLAHPVAVRSFPELGHALGPHPLLGPMSPEAQAQIVSDALSLLR